MDWFKVNGKSYNVRIFEPKESFTILYSENSGRTMAAGNPIVLDPLGTFYNYSMTIGVKKGYENEYEELWELLSAPTNEYLLLTFPRGRNSFWKTTTDDGEEVNGCYAYVSTGTRDIQRIKEQDGKLEEVIYDAFDVNFIAARAQVLPL